MYILENVYFYLLTPIYRYEDSTDEKVKKEEKPTKLETRKVK